MSTLPSITIGEEQVQLALPDEFVIIDWQMAWSEGQFPDGEDTPDDYQMNRLLQKRLGLAALGLCLPGDVDVPAYTGDEEMAAYGERVLAGLRGLGVPLKAVWSAAAHCTRAIIRVFRGVEPEEVDKVAGFSDADAASTSASASSSATDSAAAAPSPG